MPRRSYFAHQLIAPDSNWPVEAIAPAALDNTYPSYPICAYDDTTEEGRGWLTIVPASASSLTFRVIHKARTAPGAQRSVGLKLYYRVVKDAEATGAFMSLVLSDASIPGTTDFQYYSVTVPIGSGEGQLNVDVGKAVEFELTRIQPAAGTELDGDWHLLAVEEN